MSRLARFERTVVPHMDSAFNLARWLTRNDHDAEDVVQEAFLRAFRYFDTLAEADARPWMLAIVRNTCYTWLEKNRPAEIVALEDSSIIPEDAETIGHASPSDSNPEVIVLQSAQRKLINQALEELPVGYREVLVMRELEELTYKEIAQVAGIPIGTVMSRLARGRDLLKSAIEKRERRAS
jgi:RNA polymerase sigma-70 factor (ECF subfamily)